MTCGIRVWSLPNVALFFLLVFLAKTDFIYLPIRAKMLPN